MSRFLILLGVMLVLLGITYPLLQKWGLGRLPGDMIIKRGNLTFYLPIATSILASLFISVVFYFFNRQ